PELEQAIKAHPEILTIVEKDPEVIKNPKSDKMLRENPKMLATVEHYPDILRTNIEHPIIVGAIFDNPDIEASGLWSFTSYFLSFSILIVAFFLILRIISDKEGKKHVDASWWLVFLMIATMLVSCFSYYGPLREISPLEFPWDTVIELGVGIIAFYIGIKTGFATEDIKAIVAADDRSAQEEKEK